MRQKLSQGAVSKDQDDWKKQDPDPHRPEVYMYEGIDLIEEYQAINVIDPNAARIFRPIE